MTQKNYKTKNRKLDLRRYKLHILFIVTTYFSFFLLIEGHSQVNDIILSSRSFHPRDNNDTFSTIKMIKTYGVTSVEWMYCNNKSQLSQLQDLGIKYTLAVNPQTPDSLGYTAVKTRIVNIDNLPLTPPWMKEWKIKNPYWGCVNNPEFKELFISRSKSIVDLGASGIFVDDARFNDVAKAWGGCYCSYCMKGFTQFLLSQNEHVPNDFDYRQYLKVQSVNQDSVYNLKLKKLFDLYQTQSVVVFITEWRNIISSYANRTFTFFTNNFNGIWDSPIYKIFDGGIAEMPANPSNTPDRILNVINKSKLLNKKQVFSYRETDVLANTSFILWSYLNGTPALVPWDIFIDMGGGKPATRYFGKENEYVDLFRFIKQKSELFEKNNKPLPNKDIMIKSPDYYKTIIRKNNDGYYLFICRDNYNPNSADGSVLLEIKSNDININPIDILQNITKSTIQKIGTNQWSIKAAAGIIKLGKL